jgi:tetratricopeptide (TPR) repeat protein
MAKRKSSPKPHDAPVPQEIMQYLQAMLEQYEQLGPPPRQKKQSKKKSSPVESLIEQAMDAGSTEEAYPLLLKAEKLDPKNVDALSMLSQAAPGLLERLSYARKVVDAYRERIPERTWNDLQGQLWLDHDCRPYLSALWELAEKQWECTQFEEAIATANELLVLNKNDNQGVRESLVKWLLDQRQFDQAMELLDQYPKDGLLASCYTRALLVFQKEGDTPHARQLLKLARKCNKHAPSYLMGESITQEMNADNYQTGSKEEAMIYSLSFRVHWIIMPGAMDWLVEQCKANRKLKDPALDEVLLQQVMALPQENTGWVLEYRQAPHPMKKGKRIVLPWLLIIMHTETGLVIANSVLPDEPQVADLLQIITDAMQSPLTQRLNPHRPGGVVVVRRETTMLLGQYLKPMDIELVVHEQIVELDELFEDMIGMISKDERKEPALVNIPDITPDELELFYQRTTDFFRQAPWLRTVHERLIHLECPHVRSKPFFSTIMGRLGVTFGFSVYFEEQALKETFAGQGDHRLLDCGSMRFDYPEEISAYDRMNIEKHHYALPAINTYPNLMQVMKGFRVIQPTRELFEVTTLLAAGIPQLVAQRKLTDPMPLEYVDEQGKLIRLSWSQDVPPW